MWYVHSVAVAQGRSTRGLLGLMGEPLNAIPSFADIQVRGRLRTRISTNGGMANVDIHHHAIVSKLWMSAANCHPIAHGMSKNDFDMHMHIFLTCT